MPLQLEIVSEHREIVGADAVREFHEEGGTIGRSLENDWILPDPDRYISGRHATIDYKGGVYYLADVSSNGVYVNGAREPIGKGNPRRLFSGDRLRMGDFEIVVTIDRGESIVMPLEGDQTELPEPIEQPVAETSLRSGVQLLDENELVDQVDFYSALWADDSPETDVPAAIAAPEPATPKPRLKPAKVEKSQALPVKVTAEDLFDTFLDGVGVSRADLHPAVEPSEVLQNAGLVLREFVEGASRMLSARRQLKTAFNLDQTTVLPRHNNPLKLAANPGDSVMQLLVGQEGEYLGPRDAAREVCRDLLSHQDAMLGAMKQAFSEFSDRFDPDELLATFRREGGAIPLLGFLDKLRYWQMYCDLYPVLTEKGSSQFPQVFVEEFVRAYERQVADAKRADAGSEAASMKRTGAHRLPPAAESAGPDDLTDPSLEVLGPEIVNVDDDAALEDSMSVDFDESFNDLFDDDNAA